MTERLPDPLTGGLGEADHLGRNLVSSVELAELVVGRKPHEPQPLGPVVRMLAMRRREEGVELGQYLAGLSGLGPDQQPCHVGQRGRSWLHGRRPDMWRP